MRKVEENFGANVKNTFANEVSKMGIVQGGDSMIAVNDMINAIPQNEEEDIIRRKIHKSPSKKTVGKQTIKKPIGKVGMMLPIVGEKTKSVEAKEATGAAGGSGSFETSLFMEPKKLDMFKSEQPKTKVKGGFVYEEETGPNGSGKFEYEVGGHKQDTFKKHVDEKWSEKYKKSIDCNNPKGFSQKAHCQSKKVKQMSEEVLKGGKSDGKTLTDIAKKHDKKGYYDLKDMVSSLQKQLNKGIRVEMEHTDDKTKAKEIAMDHLWEDPKYYDKLKKIEANEATDSSSSGSYETNSIWAKSTNKKHWRGAAKTQIPGGKFVQVKKKCKKFPYCNQGDINALKIFENKEVKKAIKNISDKHNISENVIKTILSYEYEKTKLNK
jgi:hypothetical protein